MDDILVIGAGPAGLLAAWTARQRGATVRVVATGIGTTHIAPGWIGLLDCQGPLWPAIEDWASAHPEHPYALTGLDALRGGLNALREVCASAGIRFVGDDASLPASLPGNFKMPTALGALAPAALVPESFAAGDLRNRGDAALTVIAGPARWRDFYPALCAGNLVRQGLSARGVVFELPELSHSKFDATPPGLARLFDRADVRQRVAAQLKPRLHGADRVGFPAVIGLEHSPEAWQDLQDRLGVPVFEIPTLPPSVPGMRIFNALKKALARAGVRIALDMTVARGAVEEGRVTSVAVPNVVRDTIYRTGAVILATGGLYGGGIVTDHTGAMSEPVFGLPLAAPGPRSDWFDAQFLTDRGHPVHRAGVRANRELQPVEQDGRVVLENVYVAGRQLAGYNPLAEGSAEGVLLATAYHAACTACH